MVNTDTIKSDFPFDSRRSTVYGTNGMVACGQPIATQIGVDILKKGGNAADAAVAMAFALGLLDPVSNNIGGNALCLFYDAKERRVKCIDGSGRTPSKLTLQHALNDPKVKQTNSLYKSIHAVTVPGAAAAFIDTFEKFGSGKLNLPSLIDPSIEMAENGYPVSKIASAIWSASTKTLLELGLEKNHDWLIDDCRAPLEGEIIKVPALAKTYRKMALEGKDGFYKGEVAKAFIKTVQDLGGVMTMEDLANHKSDFSEPISIEYHDLTVWQVPPPSQSVTTLMALGIIEALEKNHGVDFSKMKFNSGEYIHIVTEALRIAFADAKHYSADPETNPYPVDLLLNKDYLRERAKLVNLNQTNTSILKGYPDCIGNTTSLSVVDKEGNACSFMISLGVGFDYYPSVSGTGVVMQDRGVYFSLDTHHLNCIGPNKRPFHTLMPSIVTRKRENGHSLEASFSIVGLFMQNQGQVHCILNMKHYTPNPQHILDSPRLCITSTEKTRLDFNNSEDPADYILLCESGLSEETINELRSKGHKVKVLTPRITYVFGRGNMIMQRTDTRTGKKVFSGGCDGRTDGQACGY